MSFGSFAFRRLDARRLPRFLLAYGCIYVFNLALLEGLRAATGLGPIAAQLACLVVVAPAAYLVLKMKVFGESRVDERARPLISVVTPCYNEEQNLEDCHRALPRCSGASFPIATSSTSSATTPRATAASTSCVGSRAKTGA